MDSSYPEGFSLPSSFEGFVPPDDLYVDVLARPAGQVPTGAVKLMLVVSDPAHARVLASDLERRFCVTVVSGEDFPTSYWRFTSVIDVPDVLLVEPDLPLTPTGAVLFHILASEWGVSPEDLDGLLLVDAVRRHRPDMGVVLLVSDTAAEKMPVVWADDFTHADPHDPDAVALAAARASAAGAVALGGRRLHRVA